MAQSLSITASMGSAELLELPWNLPLEKWPKENVAALPKGISRHIVRFVHMGPHIVAIKETTEALAVREYDMLRKLDRLDVPCVEPVAIVSGRTNAKGEVLPTALVTRHLRFSLPTGLCIRKPFDPIPPGGLPMPWPRYWSAFTLLDSFGATCRCLTLFSAEMRVPLRPTWWTRKPGN